jgi:SH3-like domain-containing protein
VKDLTLYAHWARIAYGNTAKKSSLIVRQTAKTAGKQMTTIKNGGKVLILAASGNYYKVRVGKKTGFILKKAVYAQSSATAKKKATLTKKPSGGKKLATLKKRAAVTIIGASGKYYRVKYGKKTGFIAKSALKVRKS